MNTRGDADCWALTEKEKQTLRLIVRGHDAKSIARSLGLSVHTINERLRDARRKMAVSSSREAARLLLDAEGDGRAPSTPESFGDAQIGGDAPCPEGEEGSTPVSGVGRAYRSPWILIGVLLMTLFLGLLALAGSPYLASAPSPAPTVSQEASDPAVVSSAQRWLTLVDQGKWDESYQGFGKAFRKLNTPQVWAAVSEKVRAPLGAVISRTFVSQENLPAPPHGYEVVKFRTHFANKAETTETVTLDREDGAWRVVGVTIG